MTTNLENGEDKQWDIHQFKRHYEIGIFSIYCFISIKIKCYIHLVNVLQDLSVLLYASILLFLYGYP